MIRLLLTSLLLSCGSDISVITVEKRGDDSAIVSVKKVNINELSIISHFRGVLRENKLFA